MRLDGNGIVRSIAAEAERPEVGADGFPFGRKKRTELARTQDGPSVGELPAHSFAGEKKESAEDLGKDMARSGGGKTFTTEGTEGHGGELGAGEGQADELDQRAIGSYALSPYSAAAEERERVRRIYRARTVQMLRRYLRYSMECGRLPSILGSEFFRSQVTAYTVVTFEDRVIFVHDMETCLAKLDEFSRQLIARHILQEHDRWATARLLHCNEKTVRRLTPVALDLLSEILLDIGLLERVELSGENSCQGGLERENTASDCEDGKYKF